jgi:hypothetical protein
MASFFQPNGEQGWSLLSKTIKVSRLLDLHENKWLKIGSDTLAYLAEAKNDTKVLYVTH